ncbi:MAG: hypothetical protein U5L09_00925 [Bacteroidales bacterium]|nr:hypothetical protein [Bacteroidales bacterium]
MVVYSRSVPESAHGADFYKAPNPPFGAVFTYYLKEDVKSLREMRQEKEKKLKKEKEDIDFPGWESLDKEMMQEKPQVYMTVLNDKGEMVKQVDGSRKKGFHRVNWDLSFSSPQPVGLQREESDYRRQQGSIYVGTRNIQCLSK